MQAKWGIQGMAVAPHSLASESALAVLREGGNALEAMVAAAATIAVQKSKQQMPKIPINKLESKLNIAKLGSGSKLNELVTIKKVNRSLLENSFRQS